MTQAEEPQCTNTDFIYKKSGNSRTETEKFEIKEID